MKKTVHRLFWIIVLIVVVGVFVFHYQTHRSTGSSDQESSFTIEMGDDVVVVAQTLEESGVIKHKEYLLYYFWKEKLRSKMLAGEYTIPRGATVPDIAHMITTAGKVKDDTVKVTFPEGWTTVMMAEHLTENGFDGEGFLAIANTPSDELRAEYEFIPAEKGLEGYLFPNTHIFDRDATAEIIVGKLLDDYNTQVTNELRTEVNRQGKTLNDVMIMASIVEGEVQSEKDRKLVAGLFENRLEIGQALQSDATLEYVLKNNKIQHDAKDLSYDSPYNTYMYPGLPPTPVSNPGLESIEAVIYPTPSENFFFLSNPETGETFFAVTHDEHVASKARNGL